LDCSLEPNENFSEILPSNGWRPGPGEVVGQRGLKVFHLWRHSQKPHPPANKFFFRCKLQDLPRLLTLRPGP